MIDEQRQELQAAKQAADEQIDTGQGQIDARLGRAGAGT